MIGGVASGGDFKQPHLFKDVQNVADNKVQLEEATVEKVTQGMYGVVNEGGTAAASRLEGIEFCGKSGSAQVIGGEAKGKFGKGQKKFKDNAWFVGYAPRRNPEIVVSVLIEEGEHGGLVAGPVARDIIKAYYDKKNKKTQGQYTVEFQKYDFGDGAEKSHSVVSRNEAPKSVVLQNEVARNPVKPEQSAAAIAVDDKKKPRP
jgi:penicillin-binding protein 2